ncbi:MAG TPA: sulfotransferase domain-containing protein [Nitrospirota bacterium]
MSSSITIVSGLPRTGTSLMMKMLEAGGVPVYIDNVRVADVDNPGGYYELEDVKKIKEDTSWMDAAGGKAFKMVSMLLFDLPGDRRYRIVFMERNLDEVIASQRKMLERMGKTPTDTDDHDAKRLFTKHLREVKDWLSAQENMDVLYMPYEDVMGEPQASASRVSGFMGGLDTVKMASVVRPELYRNKAEGPAVVEETVDELDDEEEEAVKERLADLGYM